MPLKLTTTSRQFDAEFAALLSLRGEAEHNVTGIVREIIDRVRREGDTALLEFTARFDRFAATEATVRVSPQEIARAIALCPPELLKSLKVAAQRIRTYSERQMPLDERFSDEQGVNLGWRWNAIDAVGLYVPGGKAAYPSSVLMNAVPALVAGVKRLAMVVPAPAGELNPAVLAAAHAVGIEEIYKIGGAQAVAALAYGTQTIAPVDKIVGPGNAYVAEAKRQVFGRVGIDMIAGPSEIVVVADSTMNPDWIAADLLSQAEHDEMAQSILITAEGGFANRVEKAIENLLQTLPRGEIARASWQNFGAVILVRSMEEAANIVNVLAPEHLEIATNESEAFAARVRHAGAIFLGPYTPEAIGDYIAGPSHVLPTSRTARFSSGLSVFDFLKRTSIIGCSAEAFSRIAMYGEVLATQEGLPAHALSLSIRGKGAK